MAKNKAPRAVSGGPAKAENGAGPATGGKAPTFRLPRDGGGTVGLKSAFGRAGTDILGVSADPVAALDRFKSRNKLAIALASDEAHKALEAYGVWRQKTLYGRKFMGIVRATFLIGPDQRIARAWPKVSVAGHAQEVLDAAKSL